MTKKSKRNCSKWPKNENSLLLFYEIKKIDRRNKAGINQILLNTFSIPRMMVVGFCLNMTGDNQAQNAATLSIKHCKVQVENLNVTSIEYTII